jgi:O-succinylhomoserine sulfhydrylase
MSKKSKHFATNAIRIQTERSAQKEHSVPIYATSSYVFDDAENARAVFADEQEGNIYTRYSNPNNDEFIRKLCALEGTEDGVSTASGMAAVFLSFISFLRAGDHVLSSRSIFGSTHQVITSVLPRFAISHTYVDANDPESWEEMVMPQTRMLFIETPSNPGLEIIDLELAAAFAEKHDLYLVVDNCFATPYLQQPATFGADIIVHSATKFIDGQGRTIGGAVLGKDRYIKDVRSLAKQTGPCLSPFNGWILSKSLETLAVRMDRHCENALKLAQFLEKDNQTKWVKYPFLSSHENHQLAKKQMTMGGALVTFELNGGKERAMKFLDSIQLLSLTSNLGDTRTTVTNPATTTHSKLSVQEREQVGITDGLIRISVGLEHIEDIVADIRQAILASGG